MRMELVERTGEAFELEEQLTVIGRQLQPGDAAPGFTLEHLDPETQALRAVSLRDTSGQVRLLNVINSLDTPVCHLETRNWEQIRADLPDGVMVYTVSMDLPFAQGRWQGAEQVVHPALSAHKSETFGIEYGVLIKEWRLLQRAVFVIDRIGTITYTEYVADQMQEPDYAAAVAAVRAAVSATPQ
jgi:thioredoxin-dependent peroxiredoxin